MQNRKANSRRVAKNTLVLYARTMLSMLVGLYTSRVVLDLLGVDDFGIYNVVAGVVTLFSFLNGALAAANSRYISFSLGENDLQKTRDTFKACLTIQVAITIIVLIGLETVGLWFVNNRLVIPSDRMVAANWIYQFSILGSIFTLLQVPSLSSIIANEKMTAYAYIGIFNTMMKLIIVFLLISATSDKLILYGGLTALVSFITFITYNIYCKRHNSEYSIRISTDIKLLKEIFGYSGWSFIGSFSNIMKLQGNNILINLFFGPAVNAARGVALQVNLALVTFVQSFTVAITPQVIKTYARKELETMMSYIFKGTKYSYLLLWFIGLPILMKTEYILGLWLVEVPKYTVIFTQLVIINTLIDSFAYILNSSIQATGKIKLYQITIGGLYLLNLPISYILFRFGEGYAPETTLFISIVISLVGAFVRVVLIKKEIPIFKPTTFFSKVYLRVLMVTIFSGGATILLNGLTGSGFKGLLLTCLISSLSVTIGTYLFGVDKSERKFIISSIRSKLSSLK